MYREALLQTGEEGLQREIGARLDNPSALRQDTRPEHAPGQVAIHPERDHALREHDPRSPGEREAHDLPGARDELHRRGPGEADRREFVSAAPEGCLEAALPKGTGEHLRDEAGALENTGGNGRAARPLFRRRSL